MARAVRMYQDRLTERGESKLQARRAVGALLGINPATLRNWVEREEIDAGVRPGTTSEDVAELARLRRENAELRRANEILKTASAFSPKRSSTADCGDRRLHRRPPRPLRGRADLRRARRAWHLDRPEHLLRHRPSAGLRVGSRRRLPRQHAVGPASFESWRLRAAQALARRPPRGPAPGP
jgi:transposase